MRAVFWVVPGAQETGLGRSETAHTLAPLPMTVHVWANYEILGGFLPGNFRTLFARFGKPNCDCLLAALHPAALAAWS
jgi:hypothetical protein